MDIEFSSYGLVLLRLSDHVGSFPASEMVNGDKYLNGDVAC